MLSTFKSGLLGMFAQTASVPRFPPASQCQESARRSGHEAQDVGSGPRTMRLHAQRRPAHLPQPCVPRGCGSRDEHSRTLSAAELRSGLPAAGAEVARDLRLAGLPPAGRLGRCDHRREECIRSLPHRRAHGSSSRSCRRRRRRRHSRSSGSSRRGRRRREITGAPMAWRCPNPHPSPNP